MRKLLVWAEYEKYKKYLMTLGKNYCPFCDIQKQIILGKSKHWTWVANIAPYWRYNILIVPKKHRLDFDELEMEELIDLQKFYKKIIKHLLSLNLKHTNGKVMKYFMFMIRTRKYEQIGKNGYNKSNHLHVNLCPDGERIKRFNLDLSAVDVDIKKISLPQYKKNKRN